MYRLAELIVSSTKGRARHDLFIWWRSEKNELNLAVHINSLYSWRHVPTEPIEAPLSPLVCFLIGRSLAGKQFPSVVDLALEFNSLRGHRQADLSGSNNPFNPLLSVIGWHLR